MNNKIKKILLTRDENWRFPGSVYDNFLALFEIAKYDKKLLDNEALGKIISSLISIESKPGGPYYSFFTNIQKINDKHIKNYTKQGKNNINKIIDPKTNEMIDRFLSIYDIHLPSLLPFSGLRKNHKKIKKEKIFRNNIKFNTDLNQVNFSKDEEKIIQKIKNLLTIKLDSFSVEFKTLARKAIKRTIEGNKDKQMSLISYYTWKALFSKNKKYFVKEEFLAELGLVNIFFWTAFIIYDDFWDKDEKADPALLPVANFFARSHSEFFSVYATKDQEFIKLFNNLMKELDDANVWEITNCHYQVFDSNLNLFKKLPNYGDYTKKYLPASGHILGPLILLLKFGCDMKGKDIKNLIFYFKHLLIAMQINDDMHDFEEDLRRGNISIVVKMILKNIYPNCKKINLEKEMGKLKEIFWFKTLPVASSAVLENTEKAKKYLKKIKSFNDVQYLENLIYFSENSARKALFEQKESIKFIKEFN